MNIDTTALASIEMTSGSFDLLVKLIGDSANWGNQPMLDLTPAEKGHFTDLKKKKLVSSFRDEGIDWCSFKFKTGQTVTSERSRSAVLENHEYFSTATISMV